MKIKMFYILLALAFVSAGTVYSQNDKNGGSVYSIFGLGDLSYSSSARTDGMGILGLSLYGNYTNSLNPAAWTRIPTTKFTTRFNFENLRSSDGTRESKRTYGNFEGFNLSVPINTGNGWIFDAGINNYSQVNYDIQVPGAVDNEKYTQYFNGNGGITRISLGFSYIILRNFSFGAQINYAFGNINKQNSIDFENSELFNTKNIYSNSISGIYVNTGLIFHGFGKLLKNKKLDNLTVGAYFSTPAVFRSTVTGKYNKSTGIDSINVSESDLKIPLAIGFGISNEFNDKLVVAADFYMQNWDNYKIRNSSGIETHPVEIKSNMRVGAGLEYTPSKKLESSLFERASYRIGGFYAADYLKINDESINTIGLSTGLSVPISRFNSIDFVFGYKIRGKSTNGLVKDNVFHFGASVNIGELWFLKPTEEY
ncbi:MAG: hypothetical protein EHM58_11875 [Ignavibacteriae bacterium]|nr:MAG: hypothetical protein EHM58_11875 [Ignavibacteriota bacterium]